MFYALPAETVFEAKAKTRRATFYLFILLVGLYILFFNLLVVAAYLFLHFKMRSRDWTGLEPLILFSTLLAIAVAAAHFFYARSKSLDDLLDQIGALPADPKDSYHSQFLDLVGEAEAATGIHGIRAVVLPTKGCNAFSLQDGKGQSAIGATEGILFKLNRPELSAVVAHEAAHLAHEDSRLVTTACFLFSVFGQINGLLGQMMSGTSYDRRSSSRGGGLSGVIVVLWLISGLGYLVTKLISMAISREREYLADADGVQICKDPLALAESLYKISRRYRGDTPDTYSSLFIMNPEDSELDEQEGLISNLFSNHPPVSKRLDRLLTWAKSDLQTVENADKDGDSITASQISPASSSAPETAFMVYQENKWVGPYTPPQLLALGNVTPTSWICLAGTQQVLRATDYAELLPLFHQQVQGTVTLNACPRCKVPLLTTRYEGTEVEQCGFCKGYLLRAGVLERLIAREDVAFSPEEIKKARIWRDSQKGPIKDRNHFPEIQCPHCQSHMARAIHSYLTQVVIDHCTNDACGAIWCDGGELETIQMIIEDAHQETAAVS